MRVIAVVNQKGGSGKTTTTVNLAAALVEKKKKILVIDLDPQASTSLWFGFKAHANHLFELFVEERTLESVIETTTIKGIDLIPSSHLLAGVEKSLASDIGAEIILKEKIY